MKNPDDNKTQGSSGRFSRRVTNPADKTQKSAWAPRSPFRIQKQTDELEDLETMQPVRVQSENAHPAGQQPPPPPPRNTVLDNLFKWRIDREKALPTFWTVASAISLTINLILIIALVLVGRELFTLKSMVGNQLLGGLYENFIYMDQSHIKTNINVADNVPISSNLPISQDTDVLLTQDTRINGATVRINSGGLSINSLANIILPAGTRLPVHLELSVPVNTTVPIKINVPVDIPLDQTELHKPFIGLQNVISPFYFMMMPEVKQPTDIGLCKVFSILCTSYFK